MLPSLESYVSSGVHTSKDNNVNLEKIQKKNYKNNVRYTMYAI